MSRRVRFSFVTANPGRLAPVPRVKYDDFAGCVSNVGYLCRRDGSHAPTLDRRGWYRRQKNSVATLIFMGPASASDPAPDVTLNSCMT